MIVCVPVTLDGRVGPAWGKASRVAVALVEAGGIAEWEEFDVGWDRLHDEGTEGGHHARVARFLMDHRVGMVVAGHMGPPMQQMLGRMGIGIRLGSGGDARRAVEQARKALA